MHRRRRNARLYAAFSVMVSARALISLSPMAVLSAHDGTRPQRTMVSARLVGPSAPLPGRAVPHDRHHRPGRHVVVGLPLVDRGLLDAEAVDEQLG